MLLQGTLPSRAPCLQQLRMHLELHDGPLTSGFCGLIGAVWFHKDFTSQRSGLCPWLWLKCFRLILAAAADICCFQLSRLPANQEAQRSPQDDSLFCFLCRISLLVLAHDPKTKIQTFVLTQSEWKHSCTQFSTISQNRIQKRVVRWWNLGDFTLLIWPKVLFILLSRLIPYNEKLFRIIFIFLNYLSNEEFPKLLCFFLSFTHHTAKTGPFWK